MEQPPHKIIDITEASDSLEASNVFNICDENLPQWINDAVEEVKTKNLNIQLLVIFSFFRVTGPRENFPAPLALAGLEGLIM